VFTRTGAVTAQSGDYTASQVTNAFDKTADDSDNVTQGTTNYFVNSTEKGNINKVEISVACSDEISLLTSGTKVTFRIPFAMTLTAVRASVNTAPIGMALVVDIHEGGSSVLGTKLSIDAGDETSTTATSAATITDSALADDAEMTIDIDQPGLSPNTGKGLKVFLIGTRA